MTASMGGRFVGECLFKAALGVQCSTEDRGVHAGKRRHFFCRDEDRFLVPQHQQAVLEVAEAGGDGPARKRPAKTQMTRH